MNIKQMLQLLDIQEVTTKKQKANGTREFKLPIKDLYCSKGSAIHVASYASGYVRRTRAGGYCPSYQLNKRCESEPKYYKIEKDGETLYRKYTNEAYKDEYRNRVKEVNNPEVKVIVNGHKYNII